MQTPDQKQFGEQQKKAAGLNELQGSMGETGIENVGDQHSPAGGCDIDAGAQPVEKCVVDIQDRRDQAH